MFTARPKGPGVTIVRRCHDDTINLHGLERTSRAGGVPERTPKPTALDMQVLVSKIGDKPLEGRTNMYVRVLSFVCRPDIDAGKINHVYRELASDASDLDGFIGSSLLMSEETCRGLALMYWRDPDAAAAAGPKLVALLGERINELLDKPPEIAGYHLVENNIDVMRHGI